MNHLLRKICTSLESLGLLFRGESRFGITRQYSQTGFTLVETLIAITILLLVIIGPMTAAQKGTQNAYFASERLTAIFLAQEAAEAVREARDSEALSVYDEVDRGVDTESTQTSDWASALTDEDCGEDLGCSYDPSYGFQKTTQQDSGGISGCAISFNDVTGTYGQYCDITGDETPFHRTVRIQAQGNGAWKVTSKVSWKNERVFGNTAQNVILETWLYDQYERYE